MIKKKEVEVRCCDICESEIPLDRCSPILGDICSKCYEVFAECFDEIGKKENLTEKALILAKSKIKLENLKK